MSNTRSVGTFIHDAHPSFDGTSWFISGANFRSRAVDEAQCSLWLADLGWPDWEITLAMDVVAKDEFIAWAEATGYGQ